MNQFSLSEFRSKVVSPARTNKYRVQITRPEFMSKYPGSYSQDIRNIPTIQFYAVSATFPTTEMKTNIQARRYGTGLSERFPSGIEYRDLMVDFLADSEGLNMKMFDDWISYIAPHRFTDSVNMAYKSEYATIIQIEAYNDNGEIHTTHTFEMAYPILITAGKYQWNETDTPLIFTVGFDYYRMRSKQG